jgi:hypothetical protein
MAAENIESHNPVFSRNGRGLEMRLGCLDLQFHVPPSYRSATVT